MTSQFRNICIIAHVDHGKTTLVDAILKQGGTFERDNDQICIMDSGELERERGITILAKNTSVRLGDVKVNIVDTPGHADFGAEVERIMSMVDGAILLVDAAEGPLPQTRFVLEKAIKQGLKIILLINKVDRPEVQGTGRIEDVINQTFDLFIDLGASEEQAEFPILYACGRQGWCTKDKEKVPALLANRNGDLGDLFRLFVDFVPPPRVENTGGFRMLVANLSYSDFVGQMAVGRIFSGKVKRNDKLYRHGVNAQGNPTLESFSVPQLFAIEGLRQVETTELIAGDIGLVSGSEDIQIGDTLVGSEDIQPLPRIKVEAPTLAMMFSINTAPFSGQDGEAVQSRKLRDRLLKEVRHNVAMRFEETESSDQFRMLGRGELQFSVLIETMRREGMEFMVGRPKVLFRTDASGAELEPIERAVCDVPEAYAGEVTEMFQTRKGIMSKYENIEGSSLQGGQRVKLEFTIPTRGLLGMRSRFMTATRGEGLMSSELVGYEELKGALAGRINGALICDRNGEAVEYALLGLEDRGVLFVEPGVQVYEGMVVGEHSRPNDLDVNPCREKKLSNVRSATKEAFVVLKGIRKMSLEQFIEWIDDDEWIEVTPKHIRVRKKLLEKNIRNSSRGKS
jgi:GTP-binding protein